VRSKRTTFPVVMPLCDENGLYYTSMHAVIIITNPWNMNVKINGWHTNNILIIIIPRKIKVISKIWDINNTSGGGRVHFDDEDDDDDDDSDDYGIKK
jgi:hypothetical protein